MDKAQEFLNLAGETEGKIKATWPKSEAGPRLFWAAVKLGGALAALGMIDKLATQEGLAELQRVLQVEAYDVLEAAAVGLASRSAVSATDLCAAAAWCTRPNSKRQNGQEADFEWVAVPKRRSQLLPDHAQWVDTIVKSDEWRLMSDCRDQATHRTFRRAIKLTVGSARIPHDEFEVGASMYPADDLVRQFARDAESWFRQFCALPSEPVPARFIS
jgi:hypothetical protein